MSKIKIKCVDVILLSMISWGIINLLKNWSNYEKCEQPIQIWIIVSIWILSVIRWY
jgi:hypothetical protein